MKMVIAEGQYGWAFPFEDPAPIEEEIYTLDQVTNLSECCREYV